jgi:hypothetical protein
VMVLPPSVFPEWCVFPNFHSDRYIT